MSKKGLYTGTNHTYERARADRVIQTSPEMNIIAVEPWGSYIIT